jgi:hypothetical protein
MERVMPTRRHVLALLAAAPAMNACAPSNLPDPVAAWRSPGAGESDPRRHALAHAILAPNPHNRQPWLIDLAGENDIVLHADLSRLLPATDPPNRQIVIGCGAFLELLVIAARETGHSATVALWPEGEPQPTLDTRPVARVTLVKDPAVTKDPLFAQILKRRTNRLKFEARDPGAALLEDVRKASENQACRATIFAGGATRDALRDLTRRAWRVEATTPVTIQESIDLTRIGAKEIAANPDGLKLDGPMMEALHMAGVVTRETLAKPGSTAYGQQLAFYDPLSASANAFVAITTATPTRVDEIEAGRAYARANLTATALGLAMHPMSQAMQEFPEMANLKAEMDRLTGAPATGRLQMLARIGFADDVPPSPRWPISHFIRP